MIYLDNAATSFPKPPSVYARVDEIMRSIGGNPGRASHRMAIEAARVVYSSREALSRLIGAKDSSRVAFTKNATEAVNIALKGLILPGDRVVTTTFEHNCVVKTLARLGESGVVVERISPDKDGILDPREAQRAVKGARMLCVTHASNVFGALEPIGELGEVCKKAGVIFMVDAAQSAGAIEVDVEAMNIDLLAGTGHKALFGLQGTGFLYAREGVEPRALIDGGTGAYEDGAVMPERLEAGTMNTPGIGALGAGVEFILNTGIDRIRRREVELVDAILTGLADIRGVRVIGPTSAFKRASLVAFTMEGVDPGQMGAILDSKYSIMVRTGTHCAPSAHEQAGTMPHGGIRVAPGFFTTDEEVEAFLRAIRAEAR